MGFPKIKHALLCRILVYVVVIGGFALPVVIAFQLNFLSDGMKVFVLMAALVGLLIYMFRNMVVLMTLDGMLGMMHYHFRARKFFALRDSFTVEKAEKRIARFGRSFNASSISPRPTVFRYRMSKSLTVFADRIEKLFLVYHVDRLDKDGYRSIITSAKANVRIFEEKNKSLRKKSSAGKPTLNRVTVIVIFSRKVDDILDRELLDLLDKGNGDGFDISVLPCVVDMDARKCTFDSMSDPYMGMQYPVKNRGIRMIRRYLFGGKFPYAISTEYLDSMADPEELDKSLWHFWYELIKENRLDEKRFKKLFKKMEHQEICFDGDYLYLKWGDRGIWQAVELDEDQKLAKIDAVEMWIYPKTNKVAKATIKEMNDLIRVYFKEQGYSVRFVRSEDL